MLEQLAEAHPLLAALAEGVALAVAHLDVDVAVARRSLELVVAEPAQFWQQPAYYYRTARRDKLLEEGARLQLVERDARNRLAAAEDVASVLSASAAATTRK